jgi:hypothetical protein
MRKEKKSLAETHPEIAKQWHLQKNGDLTPNDVTPGSGKKVWWKCEKGDDHVWVASPKHRKNGTNCPICSNRIILKSNSLQFNYPQIAKEWHPNKNGVINPFKVSPGSNKKVWWKCEKGDDHEWLETINARVKGNGCTICSNRKVVPSNSLSTTHAEIAKEWHPTKNGDLIPEDVVIGSSKKVWWKCEKGDDHEWEAVLYSRINSGCPICTGRKVVLSNSLKTKNPKLLKEWDFKKNNGINPDKIYYSSTTKVWWKCEKGDDHEWQASVQTRNNGVGCPYCSGQKVSSTNSFSNIYPGLTKMWHPAKNGNLSPKNFTSKSSKSKVWWKCEKGDDHEWQTTIANISNGNNCPFCANRKISKTNSFLNLNPSLAKEWDKEKNTGIDIYNVIYGGKKIYWWKCKKGEDHSWRASMENRIKGRGCPVCINRKVVPSNCLSTTHPYIAKEWNPTKNSNLTPNNFVSGSSKKIWWKCDAGDDHEWQTSILNRAEKGSGCLICSNQITVLSNSIKSLNPRLAKQWHPSKNGNLKPSDLGLGSNKKVWWKCDKGNDHEWKTSPNKRSSGNNCPYCTLTPQSKQELIITFELKKLFRNIDPKGLKTKLEGKLRAIDIFIPKLNLCIEFDGSYWHKDKRDIDKIKSEMLFKEGFKLIRVREEPLKKIYDTDVISKQPYNGKKVTNDILSMIILLFNLDDKLVSKLKEYQSKESLQNEKGLDKYIDKILTEKAENKNES